MRRLLMLIALAAAATVHSACGDPLVVLGESPNTVRNVVGIGDSAGNRIDTLATKSRLLNLTATAFDDATNLLYVADRGSNRVSPLGVTTQIGRLFSVTSTGRFTQLMDGGGCTTLDVCVIEATDMIVTSSDIYIADAIGNRITKFGLTSHALSAVAGRGARAPAVDGREAVSTNLSEPAGIALATDGTLYISERGTGRILSISNDGNYHVIAGGGTANIGDSPVPALNARMVAPSGLALLDNTLYIADNSLASVFALDLSAHTIVRIAGDGIAGFIGDDGPAAGARFQAPTDAELDSTGHILFIADTGNNRVRAINLDTRIITTYMGSGSTVYNGDHVAAGATSLKGPSNLESSARGFLFVVDPGHAVIRRATTAF